MAVCRYHPDRPGIGICMRCRSVICTACNTRIDGVNHCHACLKKLASRPERRPVRRAVSAGVSFLLLGVAWLFCFGVLWLVQGKLAP